MCYGGKAELHVPLPPTCRRGLERHGTGADWPMSLFRRLLPPAAAAACPHRHGPLPPPLHEVRQHPRVPSAPGLGALRGALQHLPPSGQAELSVPAPDSAPSAAPTLRAGAPGPFRDVRPRLRQPADLAAADVPARRPPPEQLLAPHGRGASPLRLPDVPAGKVHLGGQLLLPGVSVAGRAEGGAFVTGKCGSDDAIAGAEPSVRKPARADLSASAFLAGQRVVLVGRSVLGKSLSLEGPRLLPICAV